MAVCLVTGGAGFIGAHVTNHLINGGHKVVVIDDLSGGFRENVNKNADFRELSILDHSSLSDLFNEHNFEYVFHLAAYAAEGLSHFIKRFNYNNNLIGSVNLINESVKHKVKCFVFTSSIAVYGNLPSPMDEHTMPVPEDPYGIAKWSVEQELRVSKSMFGLNYIIFRPHNVYGEYQNLGDRYRNVVGIFMNQLMQDKPLTIFGDGKQTRAFSYIGDVAPYIADSINFPQAYNEVFNIGADKEYTVNELANIVMDAMGKKGMVRYVEARHEAIHSYANHDKAKRFFGMGAGAPLSEGIQRMAEWAIKTGVKSSKKFKEIEIIENLPALWKENF